MRKQRDRDLTKLQYPIVLKPARSVNERGGVRATFSVSYASDATELGRKLRALPPAAFPLLLQQRVVGPGTGIFLLLWDGELKAEFAHQRLTEKPASGGASVYRESVPIDEELRDRSRALLDQFGWRGVAMVETSVISRRGSRTSWRSRAFLGFAATGDRLRRRLPRMLVAPLRSVRTPRRCLPIGWEFEVVVVGSGRSPGWARAQLRRSAPSEHAETHVERLVISFSGRFGARITRRSLDGPTPVRSGTKAFAGWRGDDDINAPSHRDDARVGRTRRRGDDGLPSVGGAA